MKTLHIYLETGIQAFQITRSEVQTLQAALPDWQLIVLENQAQLLNALPEVELLDTWQFDAAWYALAPRLRHLFTPAAGTEGIQPDPSGRIKATHGSFHGPLIGEALLGMMLHFNRRMPIMQALQRQHRWDRNQQSQTRLLANQTALIIGYGNIGRTCARYLTQLGMRVHAYRRSETEGQDPESGATYVDAINLDKQLGGADHVILLLPGGDETRGFMDRRRLALLKQGACIYNFGRGSTLLSDDLLWALEQGLAGAGLDVTDIEPLPGDSPLWDHPDVLLTPHSSCIYADYMPMHVQQLAAQLVQLNAEPG